MLGKIGFSRVEGNDPYKVLYQIFSLLLSDIEKVYIYSNSEIW